MLNEFEVSVQTINAETIIINLHGDLTRDCEAVIHRAYAQACESGAENIILDFSAGDYVDTPALTILIDLIVEANRRGQHLLMAAPNSYLQRIFSVVGITQYATVVDNLDEARRLVAPKELLSQTVSPATL